MNNQMIVKTALQEILTRSNYDLAVVAKFFSPDYQQYVNGNVLSYADFIEHIKYLYRSLKSVSIMMLACAQNKDTVFTHHHVFAIKLDGTEIRTQVLACFTLSNGKIIRCEELTHLLNGNHQDKNLGYQIK